MTTYLTSAQVKFVIESLPETTPATDSIYITGTFNGWNTDDPKYLLRKQPNGQLSITLEINEAISEYKFSRGDWLKVETGTDNEYIPNRIFRRINDGQVVLIQIKNWQDLGGARSFEYLIFYYFAVAFLALMLMLLSHRIFKKEVYRSTLFMMTNGLIFLLFGGTVVYYVVNPIWQTYLIIFSHVLIFVWGPALYHFIHSILNKQHLSVRWVCFIPLCLAVVLAVFRLFNLEAVAFLSVDIIGYLTWGKLMMLGSGALITMIFMAKLISAERISDYRVPQHIHLFSTLFLVINAFGAVFIFINLYLDYVGSPHEIFLSQKAFFILVSLIIWLEVYALWHDPQYFKEKPQNLSIDSADELLKKLRQLMEDDKVYRDAELSVTRLADLMETKSHVLSKILNEHYEQNFRDFVNAYRVHEFIQLAHGGRLEKLTFLGLAHEVGFNSKSTFNLAFKKITNQSPRDYFKTLVL
ncbi:MAG: helix-turn-helix domain-containing protein [Reichenbachiella sp.]|uniref:helix-turn-helix domain-containing protein n=1 Tax=Reichenbachiella sp. TaxID=2184521 RepID=UPI0032678192